jgi:uncharacterized phage protein (TIGR02220 family)
MILYQVKDWDGNFENNKSREREDCSFVCVPNSHSGLGFSRIMAEKDGAAVYGVFQLIIGACSRQRKPREGWLTENGKRDGEPWTPEDLAVQFRRPVEEIVRALEVLTSPKVGWIVSAKSNGRTRKAPSARVVPAECPPNALEEKERREENEKNGKEEKEIPPDKFSGARIILFWLNDKAGRQYRETAENLELIHARLKEVDNDIEGVKEMIVRQVAQWKGDPKTDEWLRPTTLFGKQKFGGYYDNRNLPVLALKKAGQPESNQVQEKIEVKLL